MGNLDREIDLMLERSQRQYECLDQQIDLMLEGSLLLETIEGDFDFDKDEFIEEVPSPEQEKAEREAEEHAENLEKLQEYLTKKAAGVAERAIYKIMGGLLASPTYDMIATIITPLPNKAQLQSIVWWTQQWLELPSSLRLVMTRAPVIGNIALALNAGAEKVNEFAKNMLRAAGVSDAPAPGILGPLWDLLGGDPDVLAVELGSPDRELTPREAERVLEYMEKASELLAIKVMSGKGPTMKKIDGAAQILKKYFISKRVARGGSVTEELLLQEEPSDPSSSTRSSVPVPDTPSKGELDKLSKALTKEVRIPPEQAKKSLESIEETMKKQGLIEPHTELLRDSKYKQRFQGIQYLILRAAERTISQSHKTAMSGNITEIKINLNEVKENRLDESFLYMFGSWVKFILNAMFGDFDIPVSVTGNKRDIEVFAKAVGSEKKYIETAKHYGLNHATTYKSKAKLDNATKGFERETGIKWPFK